MGCTMNTTRKICLSLLLVFWSCESKSSQSHCLWPTSCEFCKKGWYGSLCDQSCTNCDIGGCDRHSGICHQCSAGYYTTDCRTTCPQHCRKSYDGKAYCDRETGKCLENCKHGWWGDKCKMKCSDGCVDSACYFYDGSCIKGRISGKSGEHCDVKCPDNCISKGSDTHDCDGKTRRCLWGCKPGCWGDKCDAKCSDGCADSACSVYDGSCIKGCISAKSGKHCDVPCSSGCLHNACTRYDGYICIHGCKPGFYGDHCNQMCSKHCADEDCFLNHSLKSVTCRNGCIGGWWSVDCQRQCPDNCASCDQISGQCPVAERKLEPSHVVIGVAIILWIVFVCAVIGVVVCRYRRRRRCDSEGSGADLLP